MRFMNAIVAAGLTVGLTACGAGDKKKSNNEETAGNQVTAEEKQQLDAEFSQIPGAAIVRVPVDANGETVGDPEMKTVAQSEGLESADSVASAFDSGAAPQKMGAESELDRDSSTQSWSQWDYYGQQGGGYGGGYGRPGHGNNCSISVGCGNAWGHNYWYNNYRPVLYTQGRGWNYGYYRPSHYVTGGYRYYCYRPYRYW
jgi:hypothetical protein